MNTSRVNFINDFQEICIESEIEVVMSKDILSMVGKSKPSKVTKSLTSQAQNSISSISSKSQTNKQSVHTSSIIGEYLIKIIPKNFSLTETPVSIVAFDLDGTLINTKSGSKFARSSTDWRWFNQSVISKLKSIKNNSPIVIFTNQGGVVAKQTSKSYQNFVGRIQSILESLKSEGIDISRIWVYASPKKAAGYKGDSVKSFEEMRKPQRGMFDNFIKDFGGEDKILIKDSIYVGDAAGRSNDFSDSDLKFAENINLNFKVPEDYFV
ncbi:putative polynucleotide phosphatase/kinase [Wickerhamomyces ciferrii]|uniref:Polynucleotide phosphatase/kinase n=1 Tax=Wickerhamomyces ciferrii (strain ATCC 14091 / BCRC 22168 / CBS 111 / JCM 3599 / NBRC 0793 / NRRL Y-1031 F-60-10) TaxID=1206466 RepID=K0KTW0_WICCF|nr:putative polynucleotide phosphatase/kinase [Wickerhamomyces ciferrii]CCH44678.1 putative polynucleotide phosphatase/kinase [Wickerhamomyces ciferrii]